MKELQETITFLEQQIEKLKEIRDNGSGEENIWRPRYNERYYFIDSYFSIGNMTMFSDNIDRLQLERNNCFQTAEEAQKYAEHFKQILKNREL